MKINKIQAIEALNSEVKYEQDVLSYYFKKQNDIKKLAENKEITKEEIKIEINEIIDYYRNEILVDFDKLLYSLDIDSIITELTGVSKPILQTATTTAGRLRGFKQKIEIPTVDMGHYLNLKSIEFETEILDLEEFIKSDFNKLDLMCLIINELKKTNKISYCNENQKVISSLINELKKRRTELKVVVDLINNCERITLEIPNQLLYIKERLNNEC